MDSAPLDSASLWQAAARCHTQAGDPDAAARCMARAGRLDEAATLYRRGRHWLEAARCHESAGKLAAAAECYTLARSHEHAVRCYRALGHVVEAAWIECHERGRPVTAMALLAQPNAAPDAPLPTTERAAEHAAQTLPTAPSGLYRQHARQLVTARCDAGLGHPARAARSLAQLLAAIESRPAEGPATRNDDRDDDFDDGRSHQADRGLLRRRAVALADVLQRPDLAIRAHVALTGGGDAHDEWHRWAERALGESVPLPTTPDPR